MKLTDQSIINRVDTDHFRKFQLRQEPMEYCGDQLLDISTDMLRSLYTETGFRKLVFSGKSRQYLNDYKCSDVIYLDVLRSLPNRKDIIQLDEMTCIIYMKTDEYVVYEVHYIFPNTTKIGSYFMCLNIETGEGTRTGKIQTPDYTVRELTKEETNKYYGLFMSTITYLELTPITLNIINPGEKRGDILRDNHIKNESKSSVIQVNSNWNVKTVRLGGFDVRGHYRLMLVGKGRTRYEYVFIKPFKKGILRRLPQKMTVEPMTVEQQN